jgi:hypothetical protein
MNIKDNQSIFKFLIVVFLFILTFFSVKDSYAFKDNMSASVVIGQVNFTSKNANDGSTTNAYGFNYPKNIVIIGQKIIISDGLNQRILIYNSLPTSNHVAADVVIGQTNFTNHLANQGGSVKANTISNPAGLATDGIKLFVADYGNNRVLIYNSVPTVNNANADVVIGQTDMVSVSSGRSATKFGPPLGVAYDTNSGKLFVLDVNNDRILIYNSVPTTNGAAANVVVGASDFTSTTTACTQDHFCTGSAAITAADGKLFLAASCNNRVLIWNSIPTSNGAPADLVIGQANFTHCVANQGLTVAANTLSNPVKIAVLNHRLFIADYNNNRVLIYNSIPSTNNANADIVIGQPNMATSTQLNPPTSSSLYYPNDLYCDNNKIYINDYGNHRVLIYDNIINTPLLSLSGITGVTDGRLRANGSITVTDGNYNIWKMEASVNGGGYSGVTNLSNSTVANSNFTVGTTNPVTSSFYHDFSPWDNGNGLQSDWINKQSEMLNSQGYTLKLKGYNNNADSNPALFYFLPFKLNLTNTTISSTSLANGVVVNSTTPQLSLNPTISFSVNSKQRNELKENLDHYEVWVKPVTRGDWQKYLTNIPVDYDLVRNYTDNLNKDNQNNLGQGNGTYENQYLSATFSNSSSTISVRKKALQDGTVNLTSGAYQLKVRAVDKENSIQDTDTVTVNLKASANNPHNYFVTNNWFPLQINSISGANTGILSNFNPTLIKSSYSINNLNPTLKGIAFSNAKISLTVTDAFNNNSNTYQTSAFNSEWTLNPTLYPASLIDVSADDASANNYTELPTITLNYSGNNNQTEKSESTNSSSEASAKEDTQPIATPYPVTTPSEESTSTPHRFCIWKWCW